MCLAVPARIVELCAGNQAVVELGGVRKTVSLALVEGVIEDDFVIVHVGFALQRLNPAEAELTLALFRDLGESALRGAA